MTRGEKPKLEHTKTLFEDLPLKIDCAFHRLTRNKFLKIT